MVSLSLTAGADEVALDVSCRMQPSALTTWNVAQPGEATVVVDDRGPGCSRPTGMSFISSNSVVVVAVIVLTDVLARSAIVLLYHDCRLTDDVPDLVGVDVVRPAVVGPGDVACCRSGYRRSCHRRSNGLFLSPYAASGVSDRVSNASMLKIIGPAPLARVGIAGLSPSRSWRRSRSASRAIDAKLLGCGALMSTCASSNPVREVIGDDRHDNAIGAVLVTVRRRRSSGRGRWPAYAS